MSYTSPEVKNRYNRKHYEPVIINVAIGGRKCIREQATAKGYVSVSEYIRHLVIADAENQAETIAALTPPPGQINLLLNMLR